jgi:hypothetical protein
VDWSRERERDGEGENEQRVEIMRMGGLKEEVML